MKQQPLLLSPTSAATPLPPSTPHRTGIQIHWTEKAAEIIKIQHRPLKLAAKVGRLDLSPARDVHFAWNPETHSIFASRLGRQAI